ncbi:MAG TPA: heavy metal translocating P-type ATPase metal-binding domain-containing protein [Polyangiaceae bacterium]|nr:heavy metal translocating P-type ATPase metal-binding domain-containing protein [Polyangiaceae bacterium]
MSSALLATESYARPTPAAVAPVACAHCGLPVPPGLVRALEPEQFCCAGCRSVRALICSAGLEQYYALRESDVAGFPAVTSDASYADFATPQFLRQHCETVSPELLRVELYLEHVHCAACLWLLEKLPQMQSGVRSARLDLERHVLDLVWEPALVDLRAIARQLDRLGYPPRPYTDLRVRAARRDEQRRLLVRVGVAGAVAGNVMLIALALYSGAFQGMATEFRRLFEVTSLLLSVPALTYCAAEFYRGAWASVKTRTAHMDLPVTVGILVGAGYGLVSVVRGHGEVYFDTVTALIFLLLVGRYLELVQQNRAREATERAQMLTPGRARRVNASGTIDEVFVEELDVGDTVQVRIGDTIPVDGVVTLGESDVDNRLLTGESRPVTVCAETAVYAGATNLTAVLHVKSSCSGTQTRVARLMRDVERSRRGRAPVVRLADRVAGRFTLVVLALAVITFVLWWPHDPRLAVEHVIALLIVACPCALGLATPLAVSAALGRAAEERLLIKAGDVLEVIRKPALIVFDKTGTLTTGQLRMCRWEGDRSLEPLVRALEAHSIHPVARAFCAALPAEASCPVQEPVEEPGGGIRGTVEGRSLQVGAPGWLLRSGVALPPWAEAAIQEEAQAGHSPVAIADGGRLRALAFFEDPLTDAAAHSLSELRRLGYRLALLSGDAAGVTERVARALSEASGDERLFDEVVGGATPEAKLAYVRSRKLGGSVIVVGDGVNDAAALAEANVGVAVKGGAEASLLAADAYLGQSGVRQLVRLIRGARRTFRTIQRSMALSLAYNVVGVGLAMAGWVSPLLAAVLMPLSSLSVVTNAYRSRSFGRFC